MAGTMGCSLLFVIILLISTVSGVIEVSFEKGVSRLNNSLYCDYYFACHAEGETLQWRVGNNVFNYLGNSTIGSVFYGSASNCNYTATLLSLKPLSSSRSFTSALILTCQSNFNMPIICSDGSLSEETISIPEKELSLMAETTNNLIYLEHVLSQNLVNTDNSTCTNVFVCGVNNSFMNVQLGNAEFFFTEFDSIGKEIQGTSVQQAILIGNEPYSLVVAMFIVGSEVMNVTCGFPQNIIFLSGMQCRPVTTMPETSGTMESESSTVGESSTMASEGGNNLPLILGLSITIVVLLFAVVVIVITVVCYKYDKTRYFLNKKIKVRKPKKMMSNIDYNKFYEQVQYIFLTVDENAFNAATTILTAPNIENTTNNQLTSIDEGVFIGMIGSHHVCLVNETENNFQEKLENVIIKYFPIAKYLVFVGKCFVTRQKKKLNLADIVIAKRHYAMDQVGTEIIAPEIRSKFCFYPNEVENFFVEKFLFKKNREAKHLVSIIASGTNVLNEDLRDFALKPINVSFGREETSGKLLSHFKKEIDMRNNTTKKMQVITIGAVTGYVDGETVKEHEKCQFIAFQAAFHYVASKMINPHAPGNISYEIKDPMSESELTNRMSVSDISDWKERVHYLFLLLYDDEFDAATTNISGPDPSDGIIKITDSIYMGMIGSHKVGILYLGDTWHHFDDTLQYFDDLMKAIEDHFPNIKYLIRVGACAGRNDKKAELGDVLISKSIHYIHNNGKIHEQDKISMTPEINHIFGKSDKVNGLKLPGDRNAKHFEVQIASGTGMNIRLDQKMKNIVIQCKENFGFAEAGGDLVRVKDAMAKNEKEIHIIIITGVSWYQDIEVNDEWNFVASQAAFHYVINKMKQQEAN